jgi:hypothetical protein
MSNITPREIFELVQAEWGEDPRTAKPGRGKYNYSNPPVSIVVRDAACWLITRHTDFPKSQLARIFRASNNEVIDRMSQRCSQRNELCPDHAASIEKIEDRIDEIHDANSEQVPPGVTRYADLPSRQGEALAFVRSTFEATGKYPKYRDICTHMGWINTASASDCMLNLRIHGWVVLTGPGKYELAGFVHTLPPFDRRPLAPVSEAAE